MNLTPHFTLEELTVSQEAARRGIENRPGSAELANLCRLAATLEQVRALGVGPVVVSSGYRSPAVNKLVGGAAASAHMEGLAADITAPHVSVPELARRIAAAGIEFDQLILEFGAWVHIGLSAAAPRHQLLTAARAGGKVVYTAGLS